MDGIRRTGDINLTTMIVLSLVLHAVALLILILAPARETPRLTFGPVYSVDLVSTPASAGEPRRVSIISDALSKKSATVNIPVVKKIIPRETPVPAPPARAEEKAGEHTVSQAIERIRQKVSAAPAEETGPVTSRGPVELDMRMRVYYSLVWSKIKAQWALPQELLSGDGTVAVVALRISRDGEVDGITFEKSSGSKVFDESAVKAIRKAGPFPPLPEWFDESVCDVGIRFHASELKQ
ncbi:MAG: energy transducer TonB [Deltaproteobacteria bacterium]|nr:energy transducer TonB [Deltaproteobacteria bacterium]